MAVTRVKCTAQTTMATASANSEPTTTVRGAKFLTSEPSTVPSALPSAAAPTTSASSVVARSSQPGSGWVFMRKAMNIVRKPLIQRRPTLARSAETMTLGRRTWARPERSESVRSESMSGGSRMASTVPTTKSRNAARKAHVAPNRAAAPPASGPPIDAPATPARLMRLLALTSVMP